jgi:hypothetical protein
VNQIHTGVIGNDGTDLDGLSAVCIAAHQLIGTQHTDVINTGYGKGVAVSGRLRQGVVAALVGIDQTVSNLSTVDLGCIIGSPVVAVACGNGKPAERD